MGQLTCRNWSASTRIPCPRVPVSPRFCGTVCQGQCEPGYWLGSKQRVCIQPWSTDKSLSVFRPTTRARGVSLWAIVCAAALTSLALVAHDVGFRITSKHSMIGQVSFDLSRPQNSLRDKSRHVPYCTHSWPFFNTKREKSCAASPSTASLWASGTHAVLIVSLGPSHVN